MSASPESPQPNAENLEDLSFERANPASQEQAFFGGGGKCSSCGEGLVREYWASADQTLCATCAQKITARNQGKAGFRGLIKASLYGGAAALAGGGIYYLVSLSGYEFGLIAILVGFMVGYAVRAGSGGYGGRGFQLMAVMLTYIAIAGIHTPYMIEGLRAHDAESAQAADHAAGTNAGDPPPTSWLYDTMLYVFAFCLALAAPFMAGAENFMGIIILAIGLWEAWKMNRRVPIDLAGPYPIAAPSAPNPAQF
ncbi:MAG: hypothetical protein QM778_24630 [Myxococcales bacterium]